MKKIITIAFAMVSTFASLAQTGSISGTVTENTSGSPTPVPFCNVILAGTSTGATTDFDGNYSISAAPGNYDVVFSYIGLRTDTVRGVEVKPDAITPLGKLMSSDAINMEQFEVEVYADRESENILMMERKNTTELVQSVGAKELKSKGASDAAQGVKKVVGLSVVGSGNLYVRGLGDRYNSAYLNGMPLPSPDPDNKVPPLDIFPTDVISNIKVNKAFTADYYGDLTGGAVDINTKQLPDEGILKVKLGTSYNTNSTFQDFKTYNGGKNDYWGFGDDTRELPVGDSRYNANGEYDPFPTNFNSVDKKAPLDLKFGLLAGNTEDLSEKTKLGYIVSLNYRNDSRNYEGKYRVYNALGDKLIDYDYQSFQYSTQTSALASLSLVHNKKHTLSFTSLFANVSNDEFLDNGGYHFDYDLNVHARRFTFTQNKLWTNQLKGDHNFGANDGLNVNWYVGYSKVNSNEPDRRQLTYVYGDGQPSTNWLYNTLDKLENQRWYRDLEETDLSAHAELNYDLIRKPVGDNMATILALKVGADYRQKNRDYGHRIFTYELAPMSNAYPGGVDLDNPDSYINAQGYAAGNYYNDEQTGPEATHKIEQDILAYYLSADLDVIPNKFKVIAGARVEQSDQSIFYRKQSDSYYQPIREERIDATDVLPFVSMKYDLNKKNILRLSASKTLSRPGFREMAPFEYTEYFAGTKNTGNPELRNGENYNADVRYELFTGVGEVIAVGAFGKYLKDPIEKVMLATASGQLQSFKNTQEATIAGIEAELVKNLGFISKDTNFFDQLSLGFNATYMYSDITISRAQQAGEATVVLTNDNRPLQGASPWLLNFDVTWSKWFNPNFKGGITLALNTFGKRVWAAGADGLGDMYEKPVPQLNLIFTSDIKEKWTLRIGATNLLDPAIEVVQETAGEERALTTFKRGINVGFTVNYRIL